MRPAARRVLPAREYLFITAFDRARYPTAYLLQGWPEIAVQNQALGILRQLGAFVEAVDVGAAKLRGRAVGALRRAGVCDPDRLLVGRAAGRKGVVDIIGCLDGGQALFIEVKKPAKYATSPATGKLIIEDKAGEPTDEQLEFLYQAHLRGAAAGIIWAPFDVHALLPGGARR
jgi:hypothetical protein